MGTGRGDRHFRWTPAGRMGLVRSRSSIDLPASPELRQARRAAPDGQIFLLGRYALRSESRWPSLVAPLRAGVERLYYPLVEGSLALSLRLPLSYRFSP